MAVDYTRAYAAARYTLACAYTMVAMLSLGLLLTARHVTSSSGTGAASNPAPATTSSAPTSTTHHGSWQRTFHIFVLMGLLGRALFMFLQPSIQQNVIDVPNCVNAFVSFMPSLLFFSGYICLLCFWAEIYSLAQPLSKASDGREGRRLARVYLIVNVAMYAVYAILMACDLPICFSDVPPSDPDYPTFNSIIQLIASSLNAATYIILAGLFAFFGVRFNQTRLAIITSTVLSRITRLDVLHKLIAVAAILAVIFCVRFGIIIKNIVNDTTSELWWFDPLYYFVLEVVPLLVIFFIFRVSSRGSTPPANSMSVSSSDGTPQSPRISKTTQVVDERVSLLGKSSSSYVLRSSHSSDVSTK